MKWVLHVTLLIAIAACTPISEMMAERTAIAQTATATFWTETPRPTNTPTPTSTAIPRAGIEPTNPYNVVISDSMLEKYLEYPLEFAPQFPSGFDYSVYGYDVSSLTATEVLHFPRKILDRELDAPFVVYTDSEGEPRLLFNPETKNLWNYQVSEYLVPDTKLLLRAGIAYDPELPIWGKLAEASPGDYAEFWYRIISLNYIYWRHPEQTANFIDINDARSNPPFIGCLPETKPLKSNELAQNDWYGKMGTGRYSTYVIVGCDLKDKNSARLFFDKADELLRQDLAELEDEASLLMKLGPSTEIHLFNAPLNIMYWVRNIDLPGSSLYIGGFYHSRGFTSVEHVSPYLIESAVYLGGRPPDVFPEKVGGTPLDFGSNNIPFFWELIDLLIERYTNPARLMEWIGRLEEAGMNPSRDGYPVRDWHDKPPILVEEILKDTLMPMPTPTIGIHSKKTSLKDGMLMFYVPAGEFTMGSNDGPANARPAHTVYLDAFWIDATEVTSGMYVKCVQEGGCTSPNPNTYQPPSTGSDKWAYYWDNQNMKFYPMVTISLEQARAYCEWAGRSLPTEAEWEKAARGTDGRTFPWAYEDVEPNPSILNFEEYLGHPVPVGSYNGNASAFSAFDMAGNVWEYVSDWYDKNYYSISPYENPKGPETGYFHVIRGGSWYSTASEVTTFYRGYESQNGASTLTVGFRCVSSP